jgi:hypothetical protein
LLAAMAAGGLLVAMAAAAAMVCELLAAMAAAQATREAAANAEGATRFRGVRFWARAGLIYFSYKKAQVSREAALAFFTPFACQ